jgi:mevalonate pyrophosphate decarboxylase
MYGRCFKGVDPALEGYSKLVAIHEEANHEIVHRGRFRKADRTTHETFDAGPQVDVLTLNPLGIVLAHLVLLRGDTALVRSPAIGVKSRDTKRL